MNLDRWLEPTKIEVSATAISANPARGGGEIAEIAGIAVAAPPTLKTGAQQREGVDAPESTCMICGQPANDADSNVLHERSDDSVYRRVHVAAECYDRWFEAAFGKRPTPVEL